MVKTVVSSAMPVGESLEVKKNRITPLNPDPDMKIFSVVTGTHGDELEGQYVCYLLNKILNEHRDQLTGIVDIYPALNPLGVDTVTRGIPIFDLDMNRIFPGDQNGSMAEYIAAGIVEELSQSNYCIDIHASNIYLMEIPQIRISEENAEVLVPLAKKMNVDFIWVHGAATVLHGTLAHSLNSIGVKTLVCEMGIGMRLTKAYGVQLVDGILNLLHELGMWKGEVKEVREPIVADDPEKVFFINAPAAGIFIQAVPHWSKVKKGQLVGQIVSPLDGSVLADLYSEVDGILFTVREYPICSQGSLIARILEMEE